MDGNISYYLDLPESHSRQVICEESYEEALRKIAENHGAAELTLPVKDEKKTVFKEAIAKDGAQVSIIVDSFEHSETVA